MYHWGFIAGNSNTYWIRIWSVISITVRSIPALLRFSTESPACSRWQGMLQRIHKSLIVKHWLVISLLFLIDLLLEQFPLHERIIQFSVCIAELMVIYEQFESFSETCFWSMVFGQWRHQLRMLNNECWVKTLWLQKFSDQLVNESNRCPWRGTNHLMFNTLSIKERPWFFWIEILRQLLAKFLLKFLHHRDPSPGWSEIDVKYFCIVLRVWMKFNDVAASDLQNHLWKHVLG